MLHYIPNQLRVCPYCSKRLKPNQLLDRYISSSKSCREQRSVQQDQGMQLTMPYNPEDPDANPQDDPPSAFDFHPEWLFPLVPATDMLGEAQADTAQSVDHIPKAKPRQEAVNVRDTDIYVEQFPHAVASPLGDADDPFETYKDTCSKNKIPIWHPFKNGSLQNSLCKAIYLRVKLINFLNLNCYGFCFRPQFLHLSLYSRPDLT
jgi:hypothetical protein